MTDFYNPDDWPPELAAIDEHLRIRARSMGCGCVNPSIEYDPTTGVIVLSHNPMCPALGHPAVTAFEN